MLSLSLAIQSLKKNKGRTALTLLGIVIGATAVITVLSTGQAIKGLILGELESFGTNYIQVEVKIPSTSHTSTENSFSMVGGSVISTLKESDAEEFLKLPNVTRFYTGVMGQEVLSYKGELKKAFLFGTNESFIEIDKSQVATGAFFTEDDNRSLAKVAVLGSKVKDKLFGESDAVDKQIKIGKESFRVVGVLESRGASFMMDMDNMVFVPVRTLQKKLLGIDYVSFIFTQVADPGQSEATAEDIRWVLRDRHDITDPNKDDFAVTTMAEAQKMLGTIIYGIQILLIVLGSISLVVGGVGIMNIMYVSVTERTFEIGLRKAIGATKKLILRQFLTEAVMLTALGAILGIIVGIGLSFLVSLVAQSQGFNWQFGVSVSGMILATAMSVIIGVGFGLYPARKAAALDPIEALRHE